VVADLKSDISCQKQCKIENSKAIFIDCDVSSYTEDTINHWNISLFGTLDVALNNTGIGSGLKKVCINNDKAWLKLMDVSLNGALQCIMNYLKWQNRKTGYR
jgi:NAD(P)-dependent dehydrogenase (short-subunit alcohol dehydrogenase family)